MIMSQQTNRMSIKETHYQKNSFSLSNNYTPVKSHWSFPGFRRVKSTLPPSFPHVNFTLRKRPMTYFTRAQLTVGNPVQERNFVNSSFVQWDTEAETPSPELTTKN